MPGLVDCTIMICVFGIGGELICRIAKQSYWSYSGPRHGLNTATSFLQSQPRLESATILPVWADGQTATSRTVNHNLPRVWRRAPVKSLTVRGGRDDKEEEEEDISQFTGVTVSVSVSTIVWPSPSSSSFPSPSASSTASPVPVASLPACSTLPARLADYSQSVSQSVQLQLH